MPLFSGHEQPREPHPDIGYYNLENKDALRKQASLMSEFGIDGQIFYHYWFTGKLLLEAPAQLLLQEKDVEMPFAFCWANENWTRTWDGGNGEVLIKQEYSEKDSKDFIEYLIPFFEDPRYIKIDGRPLLIVYRTALIPDLKETVELWNGVCLANKMQAPFLLAMETNVDDRIFDSGFQGSISRPFYNWPELQGLDPVSVDYYSGSHTGHIWNYSDVSLYYRKQLPAFSGNRYPCVAVSWDVSPRHGKRAIIAISNNTEPYEKWLSEAIQTTLKNQRQEQQFVFINAWNEWAEGAYLEPDLKNGYAYLEATKRVLDQFRGNV
jgi:lipopolysaccharide biosynthesis protein